MEIKDVIMKLVGPIDPIGSTHVDNERFENLKILCNLVDSLVTDIDNVAYKNERASEFSKKRAAEFAANFLTKNLGIVE